MQNAYDYIIVGGGSAGCVLAARLSEDPRARVLLLEAGERDWRLLYQMPAGFAKMTKGVGSWGFETTPQRHLGGRTLRFTQAKVLGGGSTINAQVYTRGHPQDYDEWRQLGCEGWGFSDLLPYFKKSEDNDSFNNEDHGVGGLLGVSQPCAALPICEAFFDAAQALGLPRNSDLSCQTPDGVGHYQLTQRRARRDSAATAFLGPARRRPNLTVRTGAQTLRLLLDQGCATGVEVSVRGGAAQQIRAEREVIVSAGAVGSPKLLMLSGLGPADHLRASGVTPILDQPEIGGNLQDHLDLFTICECAGDHSYDKYARPFWAAMAGVQYALTRSGPVASSLFETGGFWYADPDARSPDIQLHFGLGSGIEAGVAKMRNSGVTLNSAYLRPRARGTVRLRSTDPRDPPLIDPNYWADPHDRDMSIRGLKLTREIMRQAPLKPFIAREVLPGPDVRTKADYTDYATHNAKTDHHPAGTCRMGGDPGSVVDPRLRLRGIERLRVVDASIMPRLISSNTNAATIMIAEKAAEMIVSDGAA